MIEQFLFDHVWVAIILWVAVYITDHLLTFRGARLYQEVGKNYFEIEGSYELTPGFQRYVNERRLVNPRFLAFLWVYALVIPVFWAFAVYLQLPQVLAFIVGALLLLETVVIIRHVRTISQYSLIRQATDIIGKIQTPRWLAYKMSAIELISFAVFFLLLFVATGSWFFAGGTVSCLSTARFHWRLARKVRAALPATQAASPTSSTPSR